MKNTVFFPTFNSQRFLVEALESLTSQTERDIRIEIVDGGSTDLTPLICEEFARSDPRISFRIEPGTTPPERFNRLLDSVEGEYLYIAHSDDIQSPERVARQMRFMDENQELIMSGCDSFFWQHDFLRNGATTYHGVASYPRTQSEILPQLLFWWCFANPTLVFRIRKMRDFGKKMDTELKFAGDYLLYWDLACCGKVANLDAPLIAYRHHGASEGVRNSNAVNGEIRSVRKSIAEHAGIAKTLSDASLEAFLDLKVERNYVTGHSLEPDVYQDMFRELLDYSRHDPRFHHDEMKKNLDYYSTQLGIDPAAEQGSTENAAAEVEATASAAEESATASAGAAGFKVTIDTLLRKIRARLHT
jgi:glycosyltransferase involved in cell wall biosynthesis